MWRTTVNAKQARTIRGGIKIGRWIGDDLERLVFYKTGLLGFERLRVRAVARSIDPKLRNWVIYLRSDAK